ncbi:hypothetical protein JB92DRAFT_1651375 [Gautieria morchelliformis]|nr:hypothetical protein JB92DRAFT_1651375 [Gautieria morchelliformis]
MSDQHSSDTPRTPQRTWADYDEDPDSSLADSAEVEAALAALDDEIDTTQSALTDWGSRTLDPFDFQPRPLSIITERTEDPVSRSTSMRTSTFGPLRPHTPVSAANPSSEVLRPENLTPRSLTPSSLTHSHGRSLTDPGIRNQSPERSLRHTPRRRAGDLIAFFEDKSSSDSSSSLSSLGQIRSNTPKSPTFTTFTPSQSLPTLSRVASEAPPPSSYSSLPRSPTLPTLPSRSVSPTKSSGASLSSLLSPVRGAGSIESRPGASTTPTLAKQPPHVPGEPRSPLSSVRNIVAAWKERTPSLGKSSKPPSSSYAGEEGFFSIRRRDAGETDRSLPPLPQEPLSRQRSNGNGNGNGSGNGNGNGRTSGASTGSGSKTPFDIAELGPFAQADREVRSLLIVYVQQASLLL